MPGSVPYFSSGGWNYCLARPTTLPSIQRLISRLGLYLYTFVPALNFVLFICRHKYDFVQTCAYMFFYYVCWFLSRSNDAEFGRRVVTCRDMNPKCVEFDKEGARAQSPHPPLYIPYIFHIYFLNIFHIFP